MAGILVKQGRAGYLLDAMRRRLYSDVLVVGLRRDLTRSLEAPRAKIPITVRPLVDADHTAFQSAIRAAETGADARESMELMDRWRMLEAGVTTCYAAVDSHENLCYVQWLIQSDANRLIQDYFHGAVPELKPTEALIEGAYAFEEFRGLGIMACAMAQIAEKGADLGARWVVTFVGKDNLPSLKGCRRAGFEPFLTRRRSWRLLRRKYTFEPIQPE